MSNPSNWLKELSQPWTDGEYVKDAIARAARLSGLTYWRAFDIWYRKGIAPRPDEIEKIADAIGAKNESDTKRELHDIKARVARMEAALSRGHSHFYSPSIAVAREMVRELRHMARPVARKRGCL